MATYRYVVYDLQKNLSSTFDDADFTFNQILYWVTMVANRLRAEQQMVEGSDLFTSTFNSVPIQVDEKGRKYIDLPVQIMDLPNNAGIVYITYNSDTCKCDGPMFAQVFFESTSVAGVQHLYLDEYTTPTSKRPYFYRIGHKIDGVNVNRIYLLGLECIDVLDLEIAIKASIDPENICSLDEIIPLPDERIQELTNEVLKLGKFIMMMPNEMVNDGDDSNKITNQYSARGATLSDLGQDAPQQIVE